MNDIRARRTAVLAAAARAKSEAKAPAADQAIRRLVKSGEPVTFQAVQREAGVSHAFLYGNPDLRGRIERPPRPGPPAAAPASDANGDNTIIQALTSQITHLKKQHRDETRPCGPRSSKLTARTCNSGASSPASAGPAARNDVTTSHQSQQRHDLQKRSNHEPEPWITAGPHKTHIIGRLAWMPWRQQPLSADQGGAELAELGRLRRAGCQRCRWRGLAGRCGGVAAANRPA